MKVKEACEFADMCGLETINEAVLLINIYCMNTFSYNRAKEELEELYADLHNYDETKSIYTVINKPEA